MMIKINQRVITKNVTGLLKSPAPAVIGILYLIALFPGPIPVALMLSAAIVIGLGASLWMMLDVLGRYRVQSKHRTEIGFTNCALLAVAGGNILTIMRFGFVQPYVVLSLILVVVMVSVRISAAEYRAQQ